MIERICQQCNRMFLVKPCVAKRGGGRFCSRRCHYDSHITKVERICLKCHKPFLVVLSRKESKFCSRKCYQQARNPKIERVCQQCGRKFYVWNRDIEKGGAKYCSIECYKQTRRKLERTCQQCGKPIHIRPSTTKGGGGKFCSVTCYGLSRRRLVDQTCPICGNQFLTQPSRARLFCSQQCFSIDCRQHHHTPEAIQKIAGTSKGRHHTKETRQKQSKIVKELWQKPEYIEAHRTASSQPEYIRKHKERGIALWQNPDYVAALMKARSLKPTKPEKQLEAILNKHLPEFKYNGDGRLGIMIGGQIPDFPNVNGRKDLIEVFGDYYHSPKVIGNDWRRSELGKIMIYSSLGWRCLIIWEHELKKLPEEQIVNKIRCFQKTKEVIMKKKNT